MVSESFLPTQLLSDWGLPFSLLGSMTDIPKEGKLTRFLDFTQLIDMASECVGGKVSRVPKGRKLTLGMNTEGFILVMLT